MDQEKLRGRLRKASLVIGPVDETVPKWIENCTTPIGFVAFDLDYYSSTKAALQVFNGAASTHLPRVICYLDDLACTDIGVMNRYVGVYAAVDEFNEQFDDRKLCPIEKLRNNRPCWEIWQERMYGFHNFSHELYKVHVLPTGEEYQQLHL